MNLPLTEKQEQLWRYIASCERSPSVDEMGAAIGSKSRGYIHQTIKALEERGYVRRIPNRARSVVAHDPSKPALANVRTSELLAELERRGILLGASR
jgi:SOS-response transcriptional repressor LexA